MSIRQYFPYKNDTNNFFFKSTSESLDRPMIIIIKDSELNYICIRSTIYKLHFIRSTIIRIFTLVKKTFKSVLNHH